MTTAPKTLLSPSWQVELPRPSIHHHQLENGLTLLVQSDYSAPVVSIQIWCETGSIHEGRWLGSGISHLLEHLMFKGTLTRGNSEMAQTIHDLGGMLNAYTSFDRTVYYTDLPVEGWSTALDVLTDAVNRSILPEEEFEKEKEVIRREFAMGKDDPDQELSKLIFETAFKRHPFRFPVIGHLDLFNQLTRDDVLSYYRQRYSIQNQTLVVVGAVDPQEIFAAAEKYCASIERQPLHDLYLPEEPPQQSSRSCFQTFPTELTRLSLVYPVPGIHHEDVPALDVLALLLGGGISSTLNQKAVEKSGLAEEISAFLYAPSSTGIWGVEAHLSSEKTKPLLELIEEEIAQVSQQAPSSKEMERAIRMSLLQTIRSMKTMSGKASSIGRGWVTDRDPLLHHHYLERLQEVQPADVLYAAQKYLIPQHKNLIQLIGKNDTSLPSKTILCSKPKTNLSFKKLGQGIRTLSLPSSELPIIHLRALFTSNLLNEPSGYEGINRLTSQLLMKGTQKRTAEQLALDIEQLGGSFGADSGNNSTTCCLELLSSDWEVGLDLLCEIIAEPHFTEEELAIEKRKQACQLQEELDHPMAVARNLVRQTFYPNHPYAYSALGSLEGLNRITLQDVTRYAQEHILTQQMILGLAGPLPNERWQEMILQKLGHLPSSEKDHSISPWPRPTSSEPQRIEKIVEKQQAVLQVAFPTVELTHPDHLLLDILDEALSDLGSRLFIKIREELGLAYYVGTSQFLGLASGYFCFYLGTDPAKRLAVEAALMNEIHTLGKKGITQEEFKRAQAKLQSQEKFQLQSPSHRIYHAALDELFTLGYHFQEKRQARLAQLQLEEVNAAAQRYLNQPHYLIAVITPE